MEGLIPEGATLKPHDHLYLTDGDTRVLAAVDGTPAIATHAFGRGRGVYLAGFEYSPCNARMLLNLLLWATGKQDSLWLTDDPAAECAWYPDARRLVIINNDPEPRTVTVTTDRGPLTVALAGFETRFEEL